MLYLFRFSTHHQQKKPKSLSIISSLSPVSIICISNFYPYAFLLINTTKNQLYQLIITNVKDLPFKSYVDSLAVLPVARMNQLSHILCSSNYPERHIYSAFNQLREYLSKLSGEFQEEPDLNGPINHSTIRLHAQSQAEEICKNFQNLKSFDKTTAVKAQIEEVKAGAIENFTKMTDNTEQMQNLSNKSDKIKQNALLFEQRADDLQNKMNRRNCKIRVIMGISLISLLLLILVPIITKRLN